MKRTFAIAITCLMLVPRFATSEDNAGELAGPWQFGVQWIGDSDETPTSEQQEALRVRGLALSSAFILTSSADGEYRFVTESNWLSGVANATDSGDVFTATISTRDESGETHQIRLYGKRIDSGLYEGQFDVASWGSAVNDDTDPSNWMWTMKWSDLIYICSNHDPNHSAVTLKEMQELTRSEGCEKWEQLKRK